MRNSLIVFVVLFFSAGFILAVSQSDLEQGRQLISSNANCSSLSNEQLELMGEYLMEQMHPGDSHAFMDRMMGLEDGSVEEENFHIALARKLYCGENVGVTGFGGWSMMGYRGMMGGWNGSGWSYGNESGWGMMGWNGGGWSGMMGFGNGWGMMGGYGAYGFLNVVFSILMILAVVFFAVWLYKKLFGNENALEILKARFAKGEISKKQFEEIKKAIE